MAHIFVFSADESKKSVTLWGKCLRAPERSYGVLTEYGMVNRLWSYHSCDIEDKNVKKPVESAKKNRKTSTFKVWYFADGSLEPN